MAIQRILVPVDYSQGSGAALTEAARLAAGLSATVDVIHVWDRPSYLSETVVVGNPGSERPLTEVFRENAEAEMKAFIAGLTLPAGVPIRTRLLSGNPAGRVLEELRVGDHHLVVMGTHGRTGLKHVLLGSVAEKVVSLSPVPVLTVPARAAGKTGALASSAA
jgi:universal stress protein A